MRQTLILNQHTICGWKIFLCPSPSYNLVFSLLTRSAGRGITSYHSCRCESALQMWVSSMLSAAVLLHALLAAPEWSNARFLLNLFVDFGQNPITTGAFFETIGAFAPVVNMLAEALSASDRPQGPSPGTSPSVDGGVGRPEGWLGGPWLVVREGNPGGPHFSKPRVWDNQINNEFHLFRSMLGHIKVKATWSAILLKIACKKKLKK